MIRTELSWKDLKKKSPPPHYICSESNLIVEYNEDSIKIIGECVFPSSDNTLKTRGHVNHFHVILLMDVVFALNVLWNSARIAKETLGWTKMLSITTKSKITQKFVLDEKYAFQAQAKKAKMGIWRTSLVINDEQKVIAEVESIAQVE